MRGLQVRPRAQTRANFSIFHSVRIDVDQLLSDRKRERLEQSQAPQDAAITGGQKPKARKRKHEESPIESKGKKSKVTKDKGTPAAAASKTATPKLSITLKIGPPKEKFPCCLCVSEDTNDLLPVYDPTSTTPPLKMAHEHCASVIPETWVDDYEIDHTSSSILPQKTRVVFGVDGIVKDRWNLVSSTAIFARYVDGDLLLEMLCLFETTKQDTRSSNPMYQGQMLQSLSYYVCQGWTRPRDKL